MTCPIQSGLFVIIMYEKQYKPDQNAAPVYDHNPADFRSGTAWDPVYSRRPEGPDFIHI